MKKIIVTGASALVLFSIFYTVNLSTQSEAMKNEAIKNQNNNMAYAMKSSTDFVPLIEFKPNTTMLASDTAALEKSAPSPTPKPAPKATPKPTPKPAPKATPAPTPKASAAPSGTASKVIATAKSYLGVPYVWGGTSPSGFDCSGFIQYVFQKNGITLPRVTSDQYKVGTSVSKSNLIPGDLVFFETYKPGASHVGIYLGNNQFIHASSGQEKVMISNLTSTYYTQHYIGARRVIK